MMRNMCTFYDLAGEAVKATATAEKKVTWVMIKEAMGDVIYKLSSMKFEDPNKGGTKQAQADIEDKFDKLNDDLQTAFRNLTDSL